MNNLVCEKSDETPWYMRNLPKINVLNLRGVFEDTTLHINTRNLSAALIEANDYGIPYKSVGSFFYALPNFAVADYFSMQQGFEDSYVEWLVSHNLDEQYKLKNLTTLAFLLARSEGLPDLDPKVLQEALVNLVALIKLESAYRKGLAVVDYKQYSLFDAQKHKPGYMKKQPEA